MAGYDVALGDQGCQSCGHTDCPCTCCCHTPPLCPDCTRPLEDEGLSLWCVHCQRPVSFAEAISAGDTHA